MKTLLSALVILIIIGQYDTKIVRGYLRTGENWIFLSRFCFLSLHGRFEYEVFYEERYGTQNIDLYYDTPHQWARVYGKKSDLKTCREREGVLQIENNQFINLTTELLVSGCERISPNISNGSALIRCKGSRNFNTARDRWWYVALSNCESNKGLQLNYRFVMTNGEEGDILHHHFSADEFYILPILCVCFFNHVVIFLLAIWSAIVLKLRQLLHATYKMFLCSVFLHCFGILLMGVHYARYAMNGVGLERINMYGRIIEACAEILFILLIILLAKGYTVTRARLRQASVIKVTIFISLYCIIYAFLFVFEQRYFDPGEVLYTYSSLGGYGLVLLRTCGWFMFIYSTFFTLKHYPEKGGFYYPFFCFFTLWFVAGPTIIVISNSVIAPWVRKKVVVSVEHFVIFTGHVVFLILTRPNAHNKNFPYHVRTTQIGILEAMDNGRTTAANGTQTSSALGANTLDAFSHGGAYGVTAPQTAMDIFTVDTVGSRRNFVPSVPPAYSAAVVNNNHINGGRKENHDDHYNHRNGAAAIYDPNADMTDVDLDTNI